MALSDNSGVGRWSLDCELRLPEREDLECGRDQWLLERFRAGDRDAFIELYQEHSRAVFHFALGMTGDRSAGAEVTQDVFVWLIQNASSFDHRRGSLGAFLIGVTRKFLRRRHRNVRRWISLQSVLGTRSADILSVNQASDLLCEIDKESIRRAVLLLPWRYREVIVLCEFDGRTYEEAAALMGCAVGTVRSRLHRARELLARKFQPKSPLKVKL